MSRADLAAMTPEALAALSNAGLVKRAQREIAAGQGPQLSEDAAGTVTGTFPDGAVARLPRSVPLDDAPCTCGAPRACRHRVAVALAYASWSAASAPEAPWSPAEVDDAALEAALGKRLLEAARTTLARGLLVTVEPGPPPAAKLPSCSVRFLVPRDVAYAKCDCAAAGGGCEHLALAVWAFRAQPAGGVVALGGVASGAPGAAPPPAALDRALALAEDLLTHGIATLPPWGARFAQARAEVEGAGLCWLAGLLADLEIALEGYARRSARHGTREIAALVAELGARVRAGRADGPELPARFVLGSDQARETLLDHLRLTALGARVTHDERTRTADVFLADPDTATVLVLRKHWEFPPGTAPEEGPELARRSVAPRITLGALAAGQVVSKAVKRGANRSLSFGTGPGVRTSLAPQLGDFSHLPAPLLVTDLARHAADLAARPPRLLRPRVLAEEVHVVQVSRVLDAVYLEGEQSLHARLQDAAGNPFTLVLTHRRAAPHALAAAACALDRGPRFVTGDLRRGPGDWTLVPISFSADRLVVPDLEGPAEPPRLASGARRLPEDRIGAALAGATSALEELCHVGLRAPPAGVRERARAAARGLDEVGLSRLATRLEAAAGGARAWLDAAIRLELVGETRSRR